MQEQIEVSLETGDNERPSNEEEEITVEPDGVVIHDDETPLTEEQRRAARWRGRCAVVFYLAFLAIIILVGVRLSDQDDDDDSDKEVDVPPEGGPVNTFDPYSIVPLDYDDQRFWDLAIYLALEDVTNFFIMTTPGRPQYDAVQFLLQDPDLVVPDFPATKDERLMARYSLAVQYYAMDGRGWRFPLLNPADMCDWNQDGLGVFCDANSTLPNALHYDSMNLTGGFPDEIFTGMPDIVEFSAANNSIGTTIPETFCSLSKLKILQLSGAKLSGEIPSCLASLENLEVLDLSHNELERATDAVFASSVAVNLEGNNQLQ